MKKVITILLLCALFYGCKKEKESEEENYTLTGIVRDFDDNTPIPNAKVSVKESASPLSPVIDSAVSDANGMVSFTYKREGAYKFLFVAKANYLDPMNWKIAYLNYNDRTETLYLAKPSFVNVTAHKISGYLPLDTVDIKVLGDNSPLFGQYNNYRPLHRDKADAPDKLFNLQTVYGHNNGSIFLGALKLYFKSEIIRNGNIISTKIDSTNVIQFNTQNFTLNY